MAKYRQPGMAARRQVAPPARNLGGELVERLAWEANKADVGAEARGRGVASRQSSRRHHRPGTPRSSAPETRLINVRGNMPRWQTFSGSCGPRLDGGDLPSAVDKEALMPRRNISAK